MTLLQAGGKSPLANADVIVFYMPFNPPAKLTPPVMATAGTSASGGFKVTLNTDMVPRVGLADVGNGTDAFNAVVFAVAPLLRATEDGSKPCLHLTHLLKGALP